MGCRLVCHPGGEIVQVGAELLIVLVDFRELGIDGVDWGGDAHDARNRGAVNGDDGSFTSGNDLERLRGKLLDQVWVQLEAIPSLSKDFCQEGQGG